MNEHSDLPSQATPPFSTVLNTAAPVKPEAFSFSGRGGEYFRIWIVNLLLSIVTLGIYSAWAKVRRLRYFYDNTSVAGGSFDYHGNPIAILKGRIIAVVLLAVYNLAGAGGPLLGLAAALLLVLAGPWLLWRSLQFKLYNTSYRGIRFGFRGSLGGAARNFLMWPMLASISLGLLAPLAYQRFKRYQHSEARFGATHFSFHGSVGAFYKTFLIGLGLWLGGIIVIFLGFGGITLIQMVQVGATAVLSLVLMVLALYAWTFLAMPLWMTLLQNLVWNNTRLGEHRFQSNMRWGRTAFIVFTNVLGVVFTLGLFTPYAQIRMMRYRIESLTLLPASSLDDFVASSEAHGSATGEGLGDLLDFDLSM
ncbi:YjgN family protein [Herbaspirillum camelliae]|uniref:YjgN family protein n=1 Tax=Herbaspirillum camelliae TaxID=1892903 RepID=UPI000949E3BA|nr:YjgN family protein [Herbaspirillum camelliae]